MGLILSTKTHFQFPLKRKGRHFNKDILTKLQILKIASKENTNVFFSKYQTVDGGICCAKAWLEVRNGIKCTVLSYIFLYISKSDEKLSKLT